MVKKILLGMMAVTMVAALATSGQAEVLFADQVVAFNNTTGVVGNALGAPDGNFVTLNPFSFSNGAGSITLAFGGNFLDLQYGIDTFVVDAVTTDYNNFKVEALKMSDGLFVGLNYMGFDSQTGQSYWELPGLNYSDLYSQIRVTWLFPGSGLELDAVGVTNGVAAAVPEPGAVILLGMGLVGLAGWHRRKIRK